MQMQFFKTSRMMDVSQHQELLQNSANIPIISFSNAYRSNIRLREQQQPTPSPVPTIDSNIKNDKPKTMKWGAPTWFLLHTLAEKVHESSFPIVRKELMDVIFKICNNLPCPDCANHATRYMQGINFETIQSKKDLKDLLFRFHNAVNLKKGFSFYNYDELEMKYANAITMNIVQNFFLFFEQKTYSARMSANNFHRTRAVYVIKDWLNKNLTQHFHP